jgi:hypothetical protein
MQARVVPLSRQFVDKVHGKRAARDGATVRARTKHFVRSDLIAVEASDLPD